MTRVTLKSSSDCFSVLWRHLLNLVNENLHTLCYALEAVAIEECHHLVDEAEAVGDTFKTAFTLFCCCHDIYTIKKKVEDQEIQMLGTKLYKRHKTLIFLSLSRRYFVQFY